MPADVDAAIDALIMRVDTATRAWVGDALGLIERQGKQLAHIKTGTLRRSIIPSPVIRVTPHVWTGRVGPTVVYGRQKELGGDIYPVRAKALRFIAADGTLIITQHVYQRPIPYMRPGWEAAHPSLRPALINRIRAAIVTS